MKITKRQLIESLNRLLAGGNIPTDHPVHAVDLDVLVTTIGLDLLKEFVEEYRRIEGTRMIPGHTLVKQTVSVLTDGSVCYAEIPFRVVDLPNDEGVYRIQRTGSFAGMVRVSPMFDTIYAGTQAGSMSTIENFRVEGDRVVFGNLSKERSLTSVDMLLLGIPNDQDAVINVPAGWQDRLREIVLARANLIMARPEDMILDRKEVSDAG